MVWWEVCMEEERVQCPFLCFMESECISQVDQGLVPSTPLEELGRNSLLVEGSVLKLLLNSAAEYRTDQPTEPWINGGTNALSHHTKTWNVSAAVLCVCRYPCVSAWQWNIFQLLHVLNPGEIRKSSRMISSTTGSFTAVALFSVYSCPGLPTQTLCPASSLGESNNWKQQRRNCLGFVFQGNEGTKNHQDVLVEDVAHQGGQTLSNVLRREPCYWELQ